MAEIALEAVTIRTPCSPSNKYLKHDLQKIYFRDKLHVSMEETATKLLIICTRARN